MCKVAGSGKSANRGVCRRSNARIGRRHAALGTSGALTGLMPDRPGLLDLRWEKPQRHSGPAMAKPRASS